MRHFVYTSYWK